MFEFIKKLLKKYEELVSYFFWGIMTVICNIVAYYILSKLTSDIIANTIAFFIAVMFAYFTNTLLVFKQRVSKKTFFNFFGMRIGTLLIDDGGMWLLLFLGCNNLIAKCIINIVIIAINYICSKFIIFRKKD